MKKNAIGRGAHPSRGGKEARGYQSGGKGSARGLKGRSLYHGRKKGEGPPLTNQTSRKQITKKERGLLETEVLVLRK